MEEDGERFKDLIPGRGFIILDDFLAGYNYG